MENITCKSCGKEARIVNKVVTNDVGKAIILIKNVPSVVCDHCNTSGYFVDVHNNVTRIVRMVARLATGIVVIDYNDRENFLGSELEKSNKVTEVVL